jgi:hypothetical protein
MLDRAMRRKLLIGAAIAAALFLVALGYQCHGRPTAGPSRDSLKVIELRDSLRIARARADSLIASSQATAERAGAALAVAESLRALRAHRAPALPAPPDSAPEAIQWWKDRVDTLGVWLSQCGAEADSGRSAALTYRAAHREAVLAASVLTGQLVYAEGHLNQVAARLGELEARNRKLSPWHLGMTGGAVGGVDTQGLFAGPGLCGGATLRVRIPLIGLPIGTTLGGCAAWDMVKQDLRAGLGGSAGFSVAF